MLIQTHTSQRIERVPWNKQGIEYLCMWCSAVRAPTHTRTHTHTHARHTDAIPSYADRCLTFGKIWASNTVHGCPRVTNPTLISEKHTTSTHNLCTQPVLQKIGTSAEKCNIDKLAFELFYYTCHLYCYFHGDGREPNALHNSTKSSISVKEDYTCSFEYAHH